MFYSDSAPITFPPGMFTAPPVVTAVYEGAGVGWASVGSVLPTVDGASVRAYRINAAPSGVVRWRAEQL